MKNIDIRIESRLKELIEELAEGKGLSQSEVVRTLMRIGIAVEREGGVKISGPLGVNRPFPVPSFGGKDDRLGVRIEENLLETLKEVFSKKARSAARRAIMNGSLMVWPEKVKIEGIFEAPRPLLEPEPPKLKDKEARKLLKKLRK